MGLLCWIGEKYHSRVCALTSEVLYLTLSSGR